MPIKRIVKNVDKLVFVKYNIMLERAHTKKIQVLPDNNVLAVEDNALNLLEEESDIDVEIEEIEKDIILSSDDEDFEE